MINSKKNGGFSLIELTITMLLILSAIGIVSTVMSRAASIQSREGRRSDALTSAQAAISVMSREISNSGFGLYQAGASRTPSNGIVAFPQSDDHRIRVRANLDNAGGTSITPGPTTLAINRPGEDVTYFFDDVTKSIVRYDPYGLETSPGVFGPETSVVVNRISNVTFEYFNYDGGTSAATGPFTQPSATTARVRITVDVELDPVSGQRNPEHVTFRSEVTLRNNNYMLSQY